MNRRALAAILPWACSVLASSGALVGCSGAKHASFVVPAPAADALAMAQDASATDASGATRAAPVFGQDCAANPDCGPALVCYQFGQGQRLCTKACKSAGDCPSGSRGSQCNGKGYCKP